MKQEKSCGVIAYRMQGEQPEVLVICHRYGGHWAFPKGHVENGETETQTALRELLEETGMRAQISEGYRESTSYSPARGVMKEVVLYVGKISGGTLQPQPEEVRTAVFLPYPEAMERLTYSADKQLLEKARAYLC